MIIRRIATALIALFIGGAPWASAQAKDPWKHYYKQQEKQAKAYHKFQRKQAKAWEKYNRNQARAWDRYDRGAYHGYW
jgi:hypothetical protein